MNPLPEYLGELPNLCGQEASVDQVVAAGRAKPLFATPGGIDFGRVRAATAIALHQHQPLIPAGGGDLRTAALISNLQYMMENQGIGDNYNAPAFVWCYRRMGDFIPQLVGEGKSPRCMLEYSGTLLHGIRKMGEHHIIDALKTITCNPDYSPAVEWLGMPWGHAVAPSTPVQDFRLHVRAFQHHFAAIFGWEALERVRGFSPSEMALPNHPDVAYAFVKTLVDCGFQWVLIQEHSVQQVSNGRHPERPHMPAPVGLHQLPGRDREHHRHHQDPGLRHQAGRPDAALVRGPGAATRRTRRPLDPAAGDPDRRRRERRGR